MTAGPKPLTLANGLQLLLIPSPHALSVSAGVWVKTGGRHEEMERAGISHFLEHLVFKGTQRRSCEELKRQVEGVGGSLNGFTVEEFTCYMAKVPVRHAGRAVSVLSDLVSRPRLGPSDIEKEREVILEEIRMYEDAPGQIIHDLMNEVLWPSHPLGMLLSGTIDTVRRIRREHIVDYWRRTYHARNTLVTVVGNIDASAIERQVRQELGGWRSGKTFRYLTAPRPHRSRQVRVWKKPTEQTHVCIGAYAMPRSHPARFALEMLHVILGANMSSRLFREVREKRGLVYEIGSHIKRYQDTGAFVIAAGCDAGKLGETLRTIATELSRISRQPVSPTELRRGKEYYAGQLLMGLEDTMEHMLWVGEQVATVGRVASTDALLERIQRVTAREVQAVAQALFRRSKLHVALVGSVSVTDARRMVAESKLPD